MPSKFIFPLVLIALIIGGGAFYGGMKYQTSKNPQQPFQRANGGGGFAGATRGQGGLGGPGGQNRGGGFTNGEVVSKDANSLTVKLRDGSSKIIFFASSTSVGKMDQGSIDDVTQGMTVMVAGTPNSDGNTITATTIQIRPTPPSRDGTATTTTTK